MNTGATGGYIQPTRTQGLPGDLSLAQFIQTVLVGLSALPGSLVRPEWQVRPPKQPDLMVNWMGFGISSLDPDTYGYLGTRPDGSTEFQRQEGLQISCSIYGPDAEDTYGLLRDGFQVPENLEALRRANMGFTSIDRGLHVPDLINENFVNRVTTTIFLRRQIQRFYPILPILSAHGVVHTVVGNEEYLLDWTTQT